MLNNEQLNDLKPIFSMQFHLIKRIQKNLDIIEKSFENNEDISSQINELNKLMDYIEDNIDLLEYEDIKEWDEQNIYNLYLEKSKLIDKDLKKIKNSDWNSFVKESINYCTKNNLELFLPYETFLNEKDLEDMKKENYKNKYKWDRWDYIFVGIAGVLAALTDFLIVKIPKDLKVGIYQGQKGSNLTKKLQTLKLPANMQKYFESIAKVPYDNTGGSDHRINTPGHDPILGFIFGVYDIINNTSTTISNGKLHIENFEKLQNDGILNAFIKQVLHLISDVCTEKGLPVPFASAFRILDIGNFKRANGKTATISDIALWMYHYGYDLRHFATMSITPLTINLFLSVYFLIRNFTEETDENIKLNKNPKFRSMLLTSHSIAAAANAGKVMIYHGNPLAINYAEWLALIRYLIPSIKYWIFDNHKFKIAHMEKINDELWDELLINSYQLLDKASTREMEIIELGKK
ncbi:hypothetical protein XO10_02175 [Marinitoga sp. 1135]|uniref:hypothetical protein n=1 Tax=Marinitoga sp. 1135 TaxID=1643333 RepID=UPI001585D569|nr:hypothetical protein [Marinitoga sp. 1135]NUU95102.1 hypothetical protein [Marinitoga sp. 1135]